MRFRLAIGALALLLLGGQTAGAASGCAPLPARAPAGLPAPVDLAGGCGRIRVRPSGRIVHLPVAPPTRPPALVIPGNGTAVDSRGGHIVFLRRGKVVWRSSGRYGLDRTRHYLANAALGRTAVAFAFEQGPLYVARLGARERIVARDEYPIGWTRAGVLVTSRFRHGSAHLLARDSEGRLTRMIASGLRTFSFDRWSGSVLYLDRDGRLRSSDGLHARTLARGLSRWTSISPLTAGLIGTVEGKVAADRITILRPDGSLFARAAFPSAAAEDLGVAGNSGLIATPSGDAVAFTVTGRDTGRHSHGSERVYLLRAGDQRPALVYRRVLRFAVCERWAGLSWHGGWLLYAPSEGAVVAIDATARQRPVDLSALAARLGHGQPGDGEAALVASWSGSPPGRPWP